jgi:hypothetical protein
LIEEWFFDVEVFAHSAPSIAASSCRPLSVKR